jgi:hypothetical protein
MVLLIVLPAIVCATGRELLPRQPAYASDHEPVHGFSCAVVTMTTRRVWGHRANDKRRSAVRDSDYFLGVAVMATTINAVVGPLIRQSLCARDRPGGERMTPAYHFCADRGDIARSTRLSGADAPRPPRRGDPCRDAGTTRSARMTS